MTIGEILQITEDFFRKQSIDSARLDAEVLLAHVLHIAREELLCRGKQEMTEAAISDYRVCVRLRGKGMPVAYIRQHKEFYGMNFRVNQNVLIPRPETEHVVTLASQWIHATTGKRNPGDVIEVCEIGTGTGCIAAALAHRHPDVHVTATDISEPAIRVALDNIADLGLLSRVQVLRCDLFPISTSCLYHLILSNPPYISLPEYDSLPKTIRDYEPKEALTDLDDGCSFYRRIITEAASHLHPSGTMFFEISPSVAEKIPQWTFLTESPFALGAIHPDYAGLPRVAEITWKTSSPITVPAAAIDSLHGRE